MPTIGFLLKERGVTNPVGQRFGLTDLNENYRYPFQFVGVITEITPEGKLAIDVYKARVLKDRIKDTKVGQRVGDLNLNVN